MTTKGGNNEVLQRLRKVRAVLGFTQQEMGAKIGLARASYASIEQGFNALTLKHLEAMKSELGVNPDFLNNGTGAMFLNRHYDIPSDADLITGDEISELRKRVQELSADVEMYKEVIKKIIK